MPRNSTTMIHTARQEFDQILDALQSQAEAEATAYQVERDLFAQLLALGKLLLKVFFALCAERSGKQRAGRADGTPLRIHSWKSRRYVSLFGEIEIERPYFWAKGKGGQMPMDAALSLPDDVYSDLLREHADLLSSQMAYGSAAAVLERLLGLSLSTSALTRLVERDAEEGAAFYEDSPPPALRAEAPILVAQADGKGVPMRPSAERSTPKGSPPERSPVRLGKGQKRTKKKEAVVTSLYATDRRVRTAEEVLDSFFSPPDASSETSPRAGPQNEELPNEELSNRTDPEAQNKKVWATLEGKEVSLARLARQVRKREESSRQKESSGREKSSISDRIALSDGCRALQDQIGEQLPRFELILDFVHVSEYLWKAANVLFEETDEKRLDWVIERSRELLTGRLETVLAILREESEGENTTFTQVARYFERNADRMDYRRYLAKGWPIATGVIEGACRHLVKDRCETSGMRWCPKGAEQILGLRSVWINGDWDAYHLRRRQERHRRLYGCPLEATDTLEEQMWHMAA